MPRPKNTEPTVTQFLRLPAPIVGRVLAVLHSELEGRPPLGTLSAFYAAAAEFYLDHLAKLEREQVNGGH